jgi:hypothetical protein
MAAQSPEQPASNLLIVAGFIFAFLGGLFGIIIGAYLKFGKFKGENGEQYFRYDEASRQKGMYMLIIAVIALVLWNVATAGA